MFEQQIIDMGFIVDIPNQTYKLTFNYEINKSVTFLYIYSFNRIYYEGYGSHIMHYDLTRDQFIDKINYYRSYIRTEKINNILH